jgi:uncharacterized protein YdeI (YjbR/CyaY-like superfamily)
MPPKTTKTKATKTASTKAKAASKTAGLPTLAFATPRKWASWLKANHKTAAGLWIKMAKKSSGIPSIDYPQALEEALCYGWIDGQSKSVDAQWWVQKFTPRATRSIWSKINREKVQALIDAGRMKPAGLKEIERAKGDGRWDAAYDSFSTATVPHDLQAALDRHTKARKFFETLTGRNRYAILFRIHHAKRPETRAKRIDQFVQMCAKGETIY